MDRNKINEDFLLLLISKSATVDISSIEIEKNFDHESITLENICLGNEDNVAQIADFIRKTLKPRLPNKIFNYCKELDKAYQSVHVNIDFSIQDIYKRQELIYANQKIALRDQKDFDIGLKFRELKQEFRDRIRLWFKVFDIEFAYEKARKIENLLVYSHRLSGWSSPEYKITENLRQEVKTNFGYGSVSYFYCLLTYKNVPIVPLSEWVDYRYSRFSEVIRYTRSFRYRTAITNENGTVRYYKTKIENWFWLNALEFTKTAANLSLTNEDEFVKLYIIKECELMIDGLSSFYNLNDFDLVDESLDHFNIDEAQRYRLSLQGFELIDFKTEKIVGALDFIGKLVEYNSIVSTEKYIEIIIELCKKFIPYVHNALAGQNEELSNVKKEYSNFLVEHNVRVEMQQFYEKEQKDLESQFWIKYAEIFKQFQIEFNNSLEQQEVYTKKINLHAQNIEKLSIFIQKYNTIVQP